MKQLFARSISAALKDQPYDHQGCFMVLRVLAQHGPMSQHDIAQALFHSDAAVSRQITGLLEQRYISSKSDPTNRRRTIIALTQQGKKFLAKFEVTVNTHIAELLNELPDKRLHELIKINQELQQLIINKQTSSHD